MMNMATRAGNKCATNETIRFWDKDSEATIPLSHEFAHTAVAEVHRNMMDWSVSNANVTDCMPECT